MANPFDVFDAQDSGNPFDVFDKREKPPAAQEAEPTTWERINQGVNRLGTQFTKGLTELAGTPRVVSEALEASPELRKIFPILEITRAAGSALPTSQQMNKVIFNDLGVPEVNGTTPEGQVLDAGLRTVSQTVAMPGSMVRNLLPSFLGGAAAETAGKVTEGTKYEPYARLGTGLVVGGGAAAAQNIAGNVLQGVRNLIAPNTKETAAKIIGRNLERDRMTAAELEAAQRANPGSMAVENAGPNVTGSLRGSIAAPGQARATAQEAFDARIEGSNARTTAGLDRTLSPVDSLGVTVEDLAKTRAAQSAPAYEAAGVPRRIEVTETVRPGAPVMRQSSILNADGTPVSIMEQGAPIVEKTFNTPTINSPEISALLKESKDVQAAIAAARRLPDYKDLPANSMAMLDKAYKHLEGLEEAAIRAGNGARAFDLGNVRRDLRAAIVNENEQYGAALATYAEPSKLITSAERGKEWFTKNIDPAVVKREFSKLEPAEQEAALVGVRDWARDVIGRSDRGGAAERVWAGGNNRERLTAIQSAGNNKILNEILVAERNLFKKARDVNVGSRTAPMALEAADNAMEATSGLTDILRGRIGTGVAKIGGRLVDRMVDGRTEKTNALIAQHLTSTDPRQVGLVAALAEQARLRELARSANRRDAVLYGGLLAPSIAGVGSFQRQNGLLGD